jgi:hypothetical protein
VDLNNLSEIQRRIWDALPPEGRLVVEAYELDKVDAVKERRCTNVPEMGCGLPVDMDRFDAYIESEGWGEPPVEVRLAVLDIYERTGVCPACFTEKSANMLRRMMEELTKRAVGLSGLN